MLLAWLCRKPVHGHERLTRPLISADFIDHGAVALGAWLKRNHYLHSLP